MPEAFFSQQGGRVRHPKGVSRAETVLTAVTQVNRRLTSLCHACQRHVRLALRRRDNVVSSGACRETDPVAAGGRRRRREQLPSCGGITLSRTLSRRDNVISSHVERQTPGAEEEAGRRRLLPVGRGQRRRGNAISSGASRETGPVGAGVAEAARRWRSSWSLVGLLVLTKARALPRRPSATVCSGGAWRLPPRGGLSVQRVERPRSGRFPPRRPPSV
mmetsp:Transcript_6488/g.14983  ORF Transcript_6488/g.14983 Transcript_6488/m.14983 type:complete len:218 (+) Transcript_6488:169-822(+)